MKKTIEIQPPNHLYFHPNHKTVFLAGSIGTGGENAIKWQEDVINQLQGYNLTFFNPRRNDWNQNLTQAKENEQFHEQVTWELTGLEMADIIVMYFDPNTSSPITLLELGLHAKSGKLVVCCEDNFWRKGNVGITCEFYGVEQVNNLNELIKYLKING